MRSANCLRHLRTFSRLLLTLALVAIFGLPRARATDFLPATPEELKMTAEPQAPGAAAVILYRQVDRYDNGVTSHEDNYLRIKILTQEGRKYGDVELPFNKAAESISRVRARTIRPDGSIVNFDGKVFEKPIVKARGVQVLAKTFTLPDVQVGSIIEYLYTIDFREFLIFDSHWILSDSLFTRSAKFTLKPFFGFMLRWSWQGLPAGAPGPVEGPDHVVHLAVSNIPAFESEDFMPPERELKARVDFIYSRDRFDPDVERFWKNAGKKMNDRAEGFVGKRGAMERAVGEIVSADDAPEVKLRKIYARVQQIRNTTYEVEKTEQEAKRAKEAVNNNVEDVWKRGYGSRRQLNWLYLALVRAAGFEAYSVRVSDRSNYFFYPKSMDSNRLNSNVVLVKLNGKDIFCDPGSALTLFGMLPWWETGVAGLKLDKNGGSWIQTAVPDASSSKIERRARLKLADSGDLEGKLTVTYTGLEASQRRVQQRNADGVARKTFLENQVKAAIPAGSEVELINRPEWSGTASPLVAEFSLKVPGWVSGAGRRALLPVGIFSAGEKRLFDHARRTHPIYFEYPFQKLDDITIELPPGWQVSRVPPVKEHGGGNAVAYALKAENDNGTLHLTRTLTISVLLLEAKYYSALRSFFQTVREGDEDQIVLQPGTAVAGD